MLKVNSTVATVCCTTMYYEQTAGPRRATFAHICMLTRYVCQPIFIQIDNVLDLHF